MTLTQLRYLAAVVDPGYNISKAAEKLHATQSAISKRIRQLEEELGYDLFMRRGKSLVAMTPLGEQVLLHSRLLLKEAHNIRVCAAGEREVDHGTLVVATTYTQAVYVLPPVVRDFCRQYPHVRFDMQASGEARVLQSLVQESSDLAIFSTIAGTAPREGIAIPIYHWRRMLLVPSQHPLALLDRPVTLADLAAHRLIAFQPSALGESALERAFQSAGLEPDIVMNTADANVIAAYVESGLGVGLVLEMSLARLVGDNARVLEPPPGLPEHMVWLVVPKGRIARSYTLDFVSRMVPGLDRIDLRRMFEGAAELHWPEPPPWPQYLQRLHETYNQRQ